MDTAVLVALIAVGGVFLTALATAAGAWLGRRSTTNTQQVNVDVNALIDRIALLENELAEVKSKVSDLERAEAVYEGKIADRDKRIADLEDRVAVLEAWIRWKGDDPEVIVGGVADGYVFPFSDVDEDKE